MNSTTDVDIDALYAESALRSLCKGKWTDLSLDLNDYTQCALGGGPMRTYTVAESLSEAWYDPGCDDWVNDEQKQLAAEHNTFWSLYWSPDTPVGTCHVEGYSLKDMVLPEFADPASNQDLDTLGAVFTNFEARLRALLYRPGDHLHISYNSHKSSYHETVDEVDAIRSGGAVHNWATPNCRARAIELDSIWMLSVRDFRVSSYSLVAALRTVEWLALGGTANVQETI